MSEEILKALMQLFALVAKQDDGQEEDYREYVEAFLKQQLNTGLIQDFLDAYSNYFAELKKKASGVKLTRVSESVRILAICKRINKTLQQKQKWVVLVRLAEIVYASPNASSQKKAILKTAAEVFNISTAELNGINHLFGDKDESIQDASMLLVYGRESMKRCGNCKHVPSLHLDGQLTFLGFGSHDLFFCRYSGNNDLVLNGLPMYSGKVYLFVPGSSIRGAGAHPIYYSEIGSQYFSDVERVRLAFKAEHISLSYPGGKKVLNDVSLYEEQGNLVGIMGASGSGKTTLLNVLSGIQKPSSGYVEINGQSIHDRKKNLQGIIGYVPQDDHLIEELSVYDNLYYNAALCFSEYKIQQIIDLVEETLYSLGLNEIKDLKVGNPLQKIISGGQRKRLNIGLELMRKPPLLFVDEPTSGLSSRDSDNVMDLLRELAIKGKLIFVVIHQPGSELFKLFDKLIILDKGGELIYYGQPVEAPAYFLKADGQSLPGTGACPSCGTVNPEIIFNIIEAGVVNEYGKLTGKRRRSPEDWKAIYHANKPTATERPDRGNSKLPEIKMSGKLKQGFIYFNRDLKSKISNRQYVLINLLQAPLLAFILAYIIRYTSKENQAYQFSDNENIPAYLFMGVIVSVFLGLTLAAGELFKDRKIIKRERLLHLSKMSYLISKCALLFMLSAIQTWLLAVIGNPVAGISGNLLAYWLIFFSMACLGNLIGLIISASFNSIVTIYILVPLLIIPQLILGGAIFRFEHLNKSIGGGYHVPLLAQIMPSRWGYEALAVQQFIHNSYTKNLYEIERIESTAGWKTEYLLPELRKTHSRIRRNMALGNKGNRIELFNDFRLITSEFQKENRAGHGIRFRFMHRLKGPGWNLMVTFKISDHINRLNQYYNTLYNKSVILKEKRVKATWSKDGEKSAETRIRYFNEKLSDIVRKRTEPYKIIRTEDHEFLQVSDPVYKIPAEGTPFLKTHFYAPSKWIAGALIPCLYSNTFAIWLYCILLFILLYFNVLKKAIHSVSSILSKVTSNQ